MYTYITTMGKASIFQSDKKLRIEIKKKYVTYTNLGELDLLKAQLPHFLELVDIKETSKKLILTYNNPENYICLQQIKKKNDIIKLSILERVLANDPCKRTSDKAVLNPKNIYIGNMKEFSIAYRSNGLMPYKDKLTSEEQYKLLIYSMLSHYSYEQVELKKLKILEKERNSFLNVIEQCQTIDEIHQELKQKLYDEETKYFDLVEHERKQHKKNSRRKNHVFVASAVVIALLMATRTKVATAEIQKQVSAEIEKKEDVSKVYLSYVKGETEEANKNIHNTELSDEEIMELYLYTEQYDLMIQEYDATGAKKVIEYFYQVNEPKKILKLDKENKCSYVNNEKAILKNDKQTILAMQGSLEDIDQVRRLAYLYIETDNQQELKFITDKYGLDLEEELAKAKKDKFENPYSLKENKAEKNDKKKKSKKEEKESLENNTTEESTEE